MNETKGRFLVVWHRAAIGVGLVATAFVVTVGLFLAANAIQLRAAPPLSLPAMDQMRRDLRDKPGDAVLRDQIRALDVLARKAYFTSATFQRAGAFLLLAGGAVALGAFVLAGNLRRKLPDPRRFGPLADEGDSAPVMRRAIGFTGLILFAAVVAVAAMAGHRLASVAFEPEPGADSKTVKIEAPSFHDTREWPGFRGPGGNGLSGCSNAPIKWNAETGEGILWKVPVPRPGFGSPAVWKDRVFLSGADATNREVYAFEARTGRLLWQKKVVDVFQSPAQAPAVSDDTGHAASSVAVDGQRVFVVFANGDLAAFDFEGQRIWARNLGVQENPYGYASSLLTDGSRLYIQYDAPGAGRLMALECATGADIWTVKRDVQNSWASPILAGTGKRTELIVAANPFMAGYDPKCGTEFWRVECLGNEVAPSPAFGSGLAFGAIEYLRMAAVKPGSPASQVWEYTEDLPNVSSPLAVSGFVIFASAGGVMTCLDAVTGTALWKHEFSKGFYGSPVAAGNRVYVVDMEGVTHVVALAKEFALLSGNPLGEPSVCTPAIAEDRIYIRGRDHLFGIGVAKP